MQPSKGLHNQVVKIVVPYYTPLPSDANPDGKSLEIIALKLLKESANHSCCKVTSVSMYCLFY